MRNFASVLHHILHSDSRLVDSGICGACIGRSLIVGLLFFSAMLSANDDTESTGAFWTELGITKVLPYNFSVDLELEHRTLDWFDWSSRWNVGAGINYKLNKYWKFGLGYTFIDKHYPTKTKDHYSSKSGAWNGLNIDCANWAPRHRIALDVTASKRYWKTLRISLRERYQYTCQAARNVERIKLRDPLYDGEMNLIGLEDTTYTKDHKSAKNRHLLRSRLKVSIDKKGWRWEPYASVETHNNFADKMHLDKIRTSVGVDYTVKKGHKIGVAYIFNHENDDDGNYNIHALSIGYNYKF